jgi:hypothetical protein
MKKIITILLLVVCVAGFSQQSTDSIQKVKFFKQPYNGKNGAKVWLCIGTGAMLIGGTCQYLSTNPSIGKSYLFYDQVISDKKTQKALNFTFGFGVGVAALSTFMAVYDYSYYIKNVKSTKHTTLQFKASPSSVGLCLNFK